MPTIVVSLTFCFSQVLAKLCVVCAADSVRMLLLLQESCL